MLKSIYLGGILLCGAASVVTAIIESRRLMNSSSDAYACKKYDGFLTAEYVYGARKPLVGFMVRLQCYLEYISFAASVGLILGVCGPPGWWLNYRLCCHVLYVGESNYSPLSDNEIAKLEKKTTIEFHVKKD